MQFKDTTIYILKRWITTALILVFTSLFVSADSEKEVATGSLIRINQVGFYPSGEKIAILSSDNLIPSDKFFSIRNIETGKAVYTGSRSEPRKSTISGKETYILSFPEVKDEGKYVIEVPGIGTSFPFVVKEQALKELVKASQKAFYYQRSGIPIEEKYAGIWSRPFAHPDTAVIIHPSAASKKRPEGTFISSNKGWYDAGDYNKYVVNSGFTVGALLSLFEDYPDYIKQLSLTIPESSNSTPDLLDEIDWNLDWMLSMQDPEDGGVYHKLTTPSFEGFIQPETCEKQRYVVAKSVTASLDFAASMAQASRIFACFENDYPGKSALMLEASRRAFSWAFKNPTIYYNQKEINEQYSPTITTGEYGDNSAEDEFFWAATELFITTGEEKYLNIMMDFIPKQYKLPTWGRVDGLACLTLIRQINNLKDKGRGLAEKMREQLLQYADNAIIASDKSPYAAPYGVSSKDFFWGCNSDAASNQGITFLYAWQLTKDEKYLKVALNNMDYLLGRNPTGYCYITGFGDKSPLHLHHRISASDGIDLPIPGLLVGGPNPGRQDGCDYTSTIPDECYVDNQSSYASNEIAINWQGMFAWFVASLDACMD